MGQTQIECQREGVFDRFQQWVDAPAKLMRNVSFDWKLTFERKILLLKEAPWNVKSTV